MQQSDKLKDSSRRKNWQVQKDIMELQNGTSHKHTVSLRFTHARTDLTYLQTMRKLGQHNRFSKFPVVQSGSHCYMFRSNSVLCSRGSIQDPCGRVRRVDNQFQNFELCIVSPTTKAILHKQLFLHCRTASLHNRCFEALTYSADIIKLTGLD